MDAKERAEKVRRELDDMNYYEGTLRRDACIERHIREAEQAAMLKEKERCLKIVRDQPLFFDTVTGTRQKWVKNQIAQKIECEQTTRVVEATPNESWQVPPVIHKSDEPA